MLDETSLPHSLYIHRIKKGKQKKVDEDYNNILLCKKRPVTQSPFIFGRAEQSDQHLVVVTKKFFARTVWKEIETATDGLFILKEKARALSNWRLQATKKFPIPVSFCGGITKWPKVLRGLSSRVQNHQNK